MPSIGFIHSSNDLYGASRVLLDDVKLAIGLGFDCSVVVPFDGPLSGALRAVNARVAVDDNLKILRRAGSRLVFPSALPHGVRAADILCCWTLPTVGYAAVARAQRRPVWVSVHETAYGITGSALRAVWRALGVPTQVNSAYTRDWLQGKGSKSRIFLSYPCMPTVNKRTDGLRAVLLFGRINGFKGHVELVRAFRKYDLASEGIRLVLAGTPFAGQEANLHELEREISHVVGAEYVGQVENMWELAGANSIVACLPQRPEPFGIVPLEARAAGARCFGIPTGGMAESLAGTESILIPSGGRNIASTVRALWEAPPRPFADGIDACRTRFGSEQRLDALRALITQVTR